MIRRSGIVPTYDHFNSSFRTARSLDVRGYGLRIDLDGSRVARCDPERVVVGHCIVVSLDWKWEGGTGMELPRWIMPL